MANRSEVLVDCLEDIRAGRRTLAECAAAHPDIGAELAELAPLALSVRRPDRWQLPEEVKDRTWQQLQGAIASNGHRHDDLAFLREVGLAKPAGARRWPLWMVFAWPFNRAAQRGLPVQPGPLRELLSGSLVRAGGVLPAGMAAHPWLAAISGTLGAVAAGGAVVYAAQTAAPESPLYPVHEAVQVVTRAVGLPATAPTVLPAPTALPTASPTVPPASPTAAVFTATRASVSPVQRPAASAEDDSRVRQDQRQERRASPPPQPALPSVAVQNGRGIPAGRDPAPVSPAAVSHSGDGHGAAASLAGSPSHDGHGQPSPSATASPSSSGSHDGPGSGSPSPSASSSPSSSGHDGGSPSPSASSSPKPASSSPAPSASSSSSGDGGKSPSPSSSTSGPGSSDGGSGSGDSGSGGTSGPH